MATPSNKLKKSQYYQYPPIEISADDFVEIIFSDVEGYIIGTDGNPVSATPISVNFTDAEPGTEVLLFHNATSKPTFDAGDAVVIFREIGSYVSSVVNPISILFIGANKLMIVYGNDAAGIQDGVDFTSAGIITFDSPTQIDYSGFFWRKYGILNSSGIVNDVTVPGTPTTYDRIDILEGGSANDAYYKAGDEAEGQPFPSITSGRVLLASILRSTSGTNSIDIISPNTSDFVSKSALPNQTIQSDFTLAKHAGNLGKVFAPDANGRVTVIDFPDPRRGIFTSFYINIISPTSGEVTAKWIGYNGVIREVTDEPVTFIGLPSASNFREDLIQGLDDGALFVKSGTPNIEGATTVPSSDPDKVSLGVVTWSHTGEYEVSQPAPSTIATNKRYATRIAPNTTGKYAKVCDFNLSSSQNFHTIISFGNPVNPADIKGSAGLLLIAFTCFEDAVIASDTVQIETIGSFVDAGEFVLVYVSSEKAELYHKANHYWSRIQYAFTFYNSPLSEANFYNDQPYGSLPAGDNWSSQKSSGGVETVTGDGVDNTDPSNPVITPSGTTQTTGLFTPGIIDTSGGYTYTLLSSAGSYVKMGKLVFVMIQIRFTSTSGSPISGFFNVIDLPFEYNNLNPTSINGTCPIGEFTGSTLTDAEVSDLTGMIIPETTTIQLGYKSGGSPAPTTLSAGGRLIMAFTYTTNS